MAIWPYTDFKAKLLLLSNAFIYVLPGVTICYFYEQAKESFYSINKLECVKSKVFKVTS